MKRTKEEVIVVIENFISGAGGTWDWDDFISFPIDEPELDAARDLCNRISELYPPAKGRGGYCSEAGIDRFRSIINDLRNEPRP